MEPVYAILDVETTGISPDRGDRVIEVGISRLCGGQEIDRFSSLINPGFAVSGFITELTGITNGMLRTAPSARDVIPQALDFIGDATLVAHNASFDGKFLRSELDLTLGLTHDARFLCTLLLSRRIFQSFASHKLGYIARELRLDAGRSHRALDDAQVTGKALAIMIDRLATAYPDETVDATFLSRYQKRVRKTLPDLSSVQQCVDAGRGRAAARLCVGAPRRP